jgi:hypothetical protein
MLNTAFLENLGAVQHLKLRALLISNSTSAGGARDSAIGWGTALQVGRLRIRFLIVSLDFLIDIILPAVIWPWGDSASNRNEYQKCFLRVKAVGVYDWQPYQIHELIVLRSGNFNLLEHSGPVQACNGVALLLLSTGHHIETFRILSYITKFDSALNYILPRSNKYNCVQK